MKIARSQKEKSSREEEHAHDERQEKHGFPMFAQERKRTFMTGLDVDCQIGEENEEEFCWRDAHNMGEIQDLKLPPLYLYCCSKAHICSAVQMAAGCYRCAKGTEISFCLRADGSNWELGSTSYKFLV